MLITLNNQRTVDIPWAQYDAMSDAEFKEFMDSDYGETILDPFYDSQIDDGTRNSFSSEDDDIFSED